MSKIGRCHLPTYLTYWFWKLHVFSHSKATWECPRQPAGGKKLMKFGAIRYVLSVFWEFWQHLKTYIAIWQYNDIFHIAKNRLLMQILLVQIQHVKYENMKNIKNMKNEIKTASVLILIFPGKNNFWYQRKSLKNNLAKYFLTCGKFNHIFRPSFNRKGLSTQKLTFFGYCIRS